MLFFACSKQDAPVDPAVTTEPRYKYLALGDSYTIGQSVAVEARFPEQTAQILKLQKINISKIDYIATTGWTTVNLMSAINSQNPPANYDIVTLLIGVNDQYQHLDTGGYRTRFTQLLNKAVQLAGNRPSRVVVLSIPDYSATPFVPAPQKPNVSAEIDAFNTINKQITLANNIAYVDITPPTRQAATDNTLVANDGLHPSGTEYKKWAVLLAPIIQKVLQ
jgi:lysophospholipase L1-like esterase